MVNLRRGMETFRGDGGGKQDRSYDPRSAKRPGGDNGGSSGPVRSGAHAPSGTYLERCSLPVMLKASA